jgi:hypothetical protein
MAAVGPGREQAHVALRDLPNRHLIHFQPPPLCATRPEAGPHSGSRIPGDFTHRITEPRNQPASETRPA